MHVSVSKYRNFQQSISDKTSGNRYSDTGSAWPDLMPLATATVLLDERAFKTTMHWCSKLLAVIQLLHCWYRAVFVSVACLNINELAICSAWLRPFVVNDQQWGHTATLGIRGLWAPVWPSAYTFTPSAVAFNARLCSHTAHAFESRSEQTNVMDANACTDSKYSMCFERLSVPILSSFSLPPLQLRYFAAN